MARRSKPHYQQAKGGFIYFAETAVRPGQIKIGWSANPKIRMRELKARIGCPFVLRGVLSGCTMDEHFIHSELKTYRLDGEWFEATPEVRLVVECADPYDPTHSKRPAPAYVPVSVLPSELKAWRRSLGWAQTDAAEWLSVSLYRYAQWERGHRPVCMASMVWNDMHRAIDTAQRIYPDFRPEAFWASSTG